jgi:NADPH-dependent 2,4-dienoyl-CoA reductase/sulfur reductase-like enzyme/peroxiredoxin family protein/rhodanese-related sulfurtransferase/TusA-related sulfurtransferase
MKVIIIGGVAAGASAAARLRRLDENAEIILLERESYISYANCGLPYHLGGVIPERKSLMVMGPSRFKAWFNVDVRTESEAVAIDPEARTVTVAANDRRYTETYDQLLLATGSTPVASDLPGTDPDKVFCFWTIPDMDKVIAKAGSGARKALVAGAGFVGLEVAENLRHRGLEVTLVGSSKQVLPALDAEMGSYLAQELLNTGVRIELGHKVVSFENDGSFRAVLNDGRKLEADFVIMCAGVKPNNELAAAAGLKLGPRGHITVDEKLRTSQPGIFAAGDAVEVLQPVSGRQTAIPLAGPANKQGRIAADNMAGLDSEYHGTLGAMVIKVEKLSAAAVGLTERQLQQLQMPYRKIYTHPGSNASYYPGGAMLHLKLLFAPDGKILGAQAVGAKGADKRIDVIATAMRCGKTAPELAVLELAYAPPFNSAKDPVNFLGMIAENMQKGLCESVYSETLPEGAMLLDVREPEEFELGTIPGAVNIPLGQLRGRLGELDKSRKIAAFCRVGLRGYLASRILKQHGFDCANLSGGILTWEAMNFKPRNTAPVPPPKKPEPAAANSRTLDVRTLACPGPVVRLKKEIDAMTPGEEVRLLAATSFAPDLANWVQSSGNELAGMEMKEEHLEAVVRKKSAPTACSLSASAPAPNSDAAMVLFSNDLDKALAALIIACGMAAAGSKVSIFFTFWGLSVLRKNPAPAVKKTLISRMFGMMLPAGARKLALSKMNMAGMGTAMMKQVMARENVPSLEELLKQARELGVQFIACEMAMNVMGLQREELIEVDSVAGVASFAEMARKAGTSLFI